MTSALSCSSVVYERGGERGREERGGEVEGEKERREGERGGGGRGERGREKSTHTCT